MLGVDYVASSAATNEEFSFSDSHSCRLPPRFACCPRNGFPFSWWPCRTAPAERGRRATHCAGFQELGGSVFHSFKAGTLQVSLSGLGASGRMPWPSFKASCISADIRSIATALAWPPAGRLEGACERIIRPTGANRGFEKRSFA